MRLSQVPCAGRYAPALSVVGLRTPATGIALPGVRVAAGLGVTGDDGDERLMAASEHVRVPQADAKVAARGNRRAFGRDCSWSVLEARGSRRCATRLPGGRR